MLRTSDSNTRNSIFSSGVIPIAVANVLTALYLCGMYQAGRDCSTCMVRMCYPISRICADDQEFVFDDFYQVDERISAKYRGAGLGLTLVRDLLILLEGEVSLESEVGEGTHIRVVIPVQVTL